MSDSVEVATSGTISRSKRCLACGKPMLYRVEESGRVSSAFCGNSLCPKWLREIPEREGA